LTFCTDKSTKIFTYLCHSNIGCGVSKGGIQNLEWFLAKKKNTQRKLLNFENWSNDLLKNWMPF